MADSDAAGAQTYLAALQSQTDEERKRRLALEQRGAMVTSTSATLAALLFTLAGLSLKDGKFHLPGASRYVLVLAILLFVLAAVLGLIASVLSGGYKEIPSSWFRDRRHKPSTTSTVAVLEVFDELLGVLDWARNENRRKSKAVTAALWIEFAAIVLLAGALAFIILAVG